LNDRYGKRSKGTSPLGNASLAILIILLLAAGGFAAYRMGVFSRKQEAEPAAESTVAEEAAEDASVSHAPAASVIAPILSEQESSTSAAAELSQAEQPAPADPVEEPGLAAEDIIVCIDPGHGGKDPGCNTETRLEKDDVLKLGLAMRTAMEAQGIKVIMTREDDTFIPLDERCEIANKANATYFISVHRYIFGSDDVYGDEIWKSSNASEEASALADNVMSGLEGVGMQRNRGVREGSQDGNGDYAVLRNTEMCSILLEMGFMQNKKDNKYFDKNVDAYAEAVTQAVLDTWEEFHVDLDDVANLD
jgi:N-acetylmuramoyl-L-alanine amidase